MSLKSRIVPFAFALALTLIGPPLASGGGSAPLLSLTDAEVVVTSSGVRVLTIDGSFNFDDLVQLSFPAGLVVIQGDRFARFDLTGSVRGGVTPLVADGLDASEVPALLDLGTPAGPPAALTQVRVDRIVVVLPGQLTAGPATAILYADFDGDSFVSNAVTVTLP